jgi:hypothetical protein
MLVTNKILSICFVLIIVSCNTNSQKVLIAPYEILHDNSSKVWILDKQYENGVDLTPVNRIDKWVITFYRNRTFVLTTLKYYADYSLHQGDFRFSPDNSLLFFEWKTGQVDENKALQIDRFNLVYELKKSKSSTLKMHFIPIDKNPKPVNGKD